MYCVVDVQSSSLLCMTLICNPTPDWQKLFVTLRLSRLNQCSVPFYLLSLLNSIAIPNKSINFEQNSQFSITSKKTLRKFFFFKPHLWFWANLDISSKILDFEKNSRFPAKFLFSSKTLDFIVYLGFKHIICYWSLRFETKFLISNLNLKFILKFLFQM